MHTIVDSLHQTLLRAERILIATHINPDGDAIGSAAALAHIAKGLGRQARLLLPAPLPFHLSWLPLPVATAKNTAELGGWTPDLLILADCGDAERAGPELAAFFSEGTLPGKGWEQTVSVNIDHHISNMGFASLNWVVPDSASTGELVGLLAEHLGLPLTGDLGEAVYLTLVSDTGNFTYANTSSSCLAMASRILAAGLDIAAFTNKFENTWTIARMHLWGKILSEISLHGNGTIACCIVPRRYLDELGLGNDALEGFASWLRRLSGVRAALYVREDAPGHSKLSLRSMGDVDVQAVAALFGGGGHAAAAGAELALPPQEAAAVALAELEARMR